MQNFKKQFKGKKVTVVGLGLLGKRIKDIIFLAECGADVLVTDLKSASALRTSLNKLKKYKNIKYVLGQHRLKDFEHRDFILKGQGVPLDSPYINYAKENGIPIEMDESLFAKMAPEVKIIGITGTRGKTTTTILIYEILKEAGIKVHLGGNILGTAALPLLKKVKKGDWVVFELSSWQLQGFGEAGISPHIAVFTNFMPDHLNYYKNDLRVYMNDKSFIYKNQKKEDFLILGPKMRSSIEETKSKTIIAKINSIPKNWKINIPGAHNLENVACAVEVARILKISEKKIKKSVENFKPVKGRLELFRRKKGIDIYNDTNSTTPEATISALRALGDKKKKKIVLIIGGDKKQLDMSELLREIPKWCSKVVMFKEQGTDLIRDEVFKFKEKGIDVYEEEGLCSTVRRAFNIAEKGEIILYSPAFSSFGKYFKNEYDRGDQFTRIVRNLK